MILAALALAASTPLAITIDDLPIHGPLPPGETRMEIGRKTIAAIKAAGLPPVTGFMNGAGTQTEPDLTALLTEWRQAGFPLGNHGWSHAGLDTVGVTAFEEDVTRNEPLLGRLMTGADWHILRYPFIDEGKEQPTRLAVRRFLKDRGYRIAGVSMSFSDYLWNPPYARCVAHRDQAGIAVLETSYLAAAAEESRRTRARAAAAGAPDRPQILLMHIGAFDARMLPRLLAQYRGEGFRFVTLAEAQRDPEYKADVDPGLPPPPPDPTAQPPATDYTAMLSTICSGPAER